MEEKVDSLDVNFADFDSVKYHLSTSEDKSTFILSIGMKCFAELKNLGALDYLNNEYGRFVRNTPEAGFDFSLEIPLSEFQDEEKRGPLIKQLSMLKRNCMASPFQLAFDAQAKNMPGKLMSIPYREEETIWVNSHSDRVTVIFSVLFKDPSDIIYGKVFLQEFLDARKQLNLQNCPQVLFSKEPPMELSTLGLVVKDNLGYVTFVLSPRHYADAKRQETISLIQTFRDYLHYHIKCSKAYLHSRMRAKVQDFLKVLNRAKPEPANTEKKLASGKTFKRN